MSRRKNNFTKAMSHLKSTQIDEKINQLEEQPTNNTYGLMTVGDPSHTVQPPDIEVTELNFDLGNDDDDGKDTRGIFNDEGEILTIEPNVGDTSYILGPMASMWYSWGNFSTFGYIRESDRRMVNLGKITGRLSNWDGESGFTSYGQLTLEQAVWFMNTPKKDNAGNDASAANYRAFYPGPPSNAPDQYGRYLCTITGTPKEFETTPPPYVTNPTQGPEDASSQFSAMLDRAEKHGLSRKRAEEMSPEELSDFVEKQDALQKTIDETAKIQKEAEAEARKILIQFGIDVALTIFGGAILKGIGVAATKIPAIASIASKGAKIKNLANLFKAADKVDDAAAFAKATKVVNTATKIDDAVTAQNAAAQALYKVGAVDDVVTSVGKTGYGKSAYKGISDKVDDAAAQIMGKIGTGKEADAIKLGLNTALDAGDEAAAKAFINQADKLLGGVKGTTVSAAASSAASSSGSIVSKIKLKPQFKGGSQSFDLGGDFSDIGFSQFQSILKNPSKFNITKDSPKWKRIFKYAQDYLVQSYEPQGMVLTESRKRILREIKKPYKVPKTPTKFKGIKPRVRVTGKGLMEVPEIPKQFKPEPTIWRKHNYDKNIKVSQEKKNEVLEYVGAAADHWEYLTETRRKEKNAKRDAFYSTKKDRDFLYDYWYGGKKHKVTRKEDIDNDFLVYIEDEDGKKFSMLQSKLNEMLEEEKIKDMFDSYIPEEEQGEREKNFDKVTRLKSIVGKIKRGDIGPEYPNEPPPELVNGWHPKLGKKYKHDKLDPQSAEAMPDTGDPEIDANIKKATDAKSKARKLKTLLGKKA